MQIDIQSQHSEVHPRWRTIIQRRAAKLTEFCDRIIRLRVTLVHSTHHLRGAEEARLLAALPNNVLRVQKARASMGDAIHAAFAALEREMQASNDRRKHTGRQVTRGRREPASL